MRFATAIITSKRQFPTYDRTIESLGRSGFSEIMTLNGDPPAGEKTSVRGCTEAYKKLFSFASGLQTVKDGGLLVFEDDVIVCLGLRDYLANALWPEDYKDIAMVAPYCPTAYSSPGYDYGRWHREDQRDYIAGTQAFLYTSHMVKALAERLDPDMKSSDTDIHVGVDVQIGWIAKQLNLHIWYHIPSLVQHVGIKNSSVGFTEDLGTIYSADTFVGEDFDARSIK